MTSPVLYHFDIQLFRDKTASDNTQVPYAGALVDFYPQGATVATATTIGPGEQLHPVALYNAGDLLNADVVEAGPNGKPLQVTDPTALAEPRPWPGPITVKFSNPSATDTVVLAVGTRLIIPNRRPTLWSDPTGKVALGSSGTTDSSGRLSGYISSPRFDYVVRPVSILSTSQGAVSATPILAWPHSGPALQNRILIGVSWTSDSEGEPTVDIASVTYGAATATRLTPAGSAKCAFFVVDSPPAGLQNISVAFNPPQVPVNAVGGAYSLSNVEAFVAAATASGNGTSAQTTVPGTLAGSGVFDLLAATTGIGQSISATPATSVTGQTQRWSAFQLDGFLGVRGASSDRRPTAGGSLFRWTLSPAVEWELAGTEVRGLSAAPLRLITDAIGSTQPHPSSLNLRNFASLSATILALPESGGEIFIPSGIYTIDATVLIQKRNVTLRGEGTSSILRASSAAFDMIKVADGAHDFRMFNLQLDGNATGAAAGSCLVFDASAKNQITHCALQDVLITRAGKYGISFKNIILFDATRVVVNNGFDSGLYMSVSNKGLRFYSCSVVGNAKPIKILGNAVAIFYCGGQIENNGQDSGVNSIVIQLDAVNEALIYVLATTFENSSGGTFIKAENAPGTIVDGCFLIGGNVSTTGVNLVNSPGSRVCNCIAEGLVGELVVVGSSSQAIVYGNHGPDATSDKVSGGPAFNLKSVGGNGVMLLYTYSASTRPSANSVPIGSLIWNSSALQLQVSDGTTWQAVGP